jgi:hypothetical protein
VQVRRTLGLAGLLLGHAAACGGTGNQAVPDGGADVTSEEAVGRDDGGGGLGVGVPCNTLANTAVPVARTSVTGDLPAAAGGVAIAGHYEVTAAIFYAGHGGSNIGANSLLQQTVVLTATGAANTLGFETVEVGSYPDGGPPPTEIRGSATAVFDPDTKTVAFQGTCARPSETLGYTVETPDGGAVRLHEIRDSGLEYILTLK